MAVRILGRVFKTSARSMSNLSQAISPLQEAALEEKCILVDENDKALGPVTKRDCHKVQNNGSIILHRAFSVFVFNTKGEILLQQRSPSKVTFPHYVTNACCSHPLYDIPNERDETDAIGVKHAARRRLYHELGVPLEQTKIEDFQYITRIHYQATVDNIWGEHEIDYVLFLHKDIDLYPNPEEISYVKYVSKEDFPSFLKNLDSPITPWFKIFANTYLQGCWNSLENLNKYKDHTNIHKHSA